MFPTPSYSGAPSLSRLSDSTVYSSSGCASRRAPPAHISSPCCFVSTYNPEAAQRSKADARLAARWGHTGLRWRGAPAGVRWDRTTEPDPTVPQIWSPYPGNGQNIACCPGKSPSRTPSKTSTLPMGSLGMDILLFSAESQTGISFFSSGKSALFHLEMARGRSLRMVKNLQSLSVSYTFVQCTYVYCDSSTAFCGCQIVLMV